MDIWAEVFMMTVIFILFLFALRLIFEVIKSALELYDYCRARKKISRGYGARRLAALAALDGGDNDA